MITVFLEKDDKATFHGATGWNLLPTGALEILRGSNVMAIFAVGAWRYAAAGEPK